MSGPEVVLTGRFTVPLPAEAAYRLFTPEGERTWADGWDPSYPVACTDDTAPGTVFETSAHGHAVTTWIVVDRTARSVRYARVTPGSRAGTVAVSLDPAPDASTEVTVTYELTALSEHGRAELAEFAVGYPAFLESWRTAIAASLSG